MPGTIQDFAISCIKLAVWLPKALLEHKIKLSNLRKLIFGLGRKNKKQSKNSEKLEEVRGAALLIFPERMAANGELVHNDDTNVKITDIIRHHRMHPSKERTGMFTTGILSRTDQRDIALFYNGTMHAGENMEKLLKKRDAHVGKVIQMCDALSRNIPVSFNTVLCNCSLGAEEVTQDCRKSIFCRGEPICSLRSPIRKCHLFDQEFTPTKAHNLGSKSTQLLHKFKIRLHQIFYYLIISLMKFVKIRVSRAIC
ncbi:MAG: hypothetical protein ABI597_00625 [Gammaproteobacteria bacterium]